MDLRTALHMVRGLRASALYSCSGQNAYTYDAKTKKFLKYPIKKRQHAPSIFLADENKTGYVNLSYFNKLRNDMRGWYVVLSKSKYDPLQFSVMYMDSNFFTVR